MYALFIIAFPHDASISVPIFKHFATYDATDDRLLKNSIENDLSVIAFEIDRI